MYKLTDQNLQTYNGFQWQVEKWYEIESPDKDEELCTNKWFHFYYHPLLAVLLNPIHANIDNPRLFEIEIDGLQKDDNGLKGGCTKIKLVREIKLPEITTEQRVKFAILCALEVYQDDNFVSWANDWLSGKNRSTEAAEAAEAAAEAARAADAAARAAWAAARAAEAAAWAAAARAARAAEAAAWAADAAARATADAAAEAARAAEINLIELMEKVI